jgi:hypothetical protein
MIIRYYIHHNNIDSRIYPQKWYVYLAVAPLVIMFLLIPSKEVFGQKIYHAKTHENTALSKCINFSIKSDDSYILKANWAIDHDGVIVGVALKDSKNIYFYSTGGDLSSIESDEIYLSKGEYSLLIYSASNRDEWIALCDKFKIESPELDFEFSSNHNYEVTADFHVIKNN